MPVSTVVDGRRLFVSGDQSSLLLYFFQAAIRVFAHAVFIGEFPMEDAE